MSNEEEIKKRAIKYSKDLNGNEITKCLLDGHIIVACLIEGEHPCIGCNMSECKHNKEYKS